MKANRYTYNVSFNESSYILFNGVNKEFLIIDNRAKSSYNALLDNPDSYRETHPNLITRLKALGFIIDDETDERKGLIEARNNYIKSKEYKTTLLPTLECNYRCWYCIQKHVPPRFDPNKALLIVKHIKKYLIENKIESYVLSWFGGEPLMQIDVVDRVSNELRSFCAENNIDFCGAITSNGALLDTNAIKVLTKNDINYYQIAIDGDAVRHNQTKYEGPNDNSFALILTNIVQLLLHNQKAKVTLRVNYTLPTLRSSRLLPDICQYIPQSFRHRIIVDLQKVWQVKEDAVDIEDLKKLQEAFVSHGFELSTDHVFSMCYVEKEHYNMIYYNAGVEKCDKRGIDRLRGYINNQGDIVWTEKPIIHDYDLFSCSSPCNDCKYYPLCYGGCPVLREERILENEGKLICGYEGIFTIFEHRIQDYCMRVINNTKIQQP